MEDPVCVVECVHVNDFEVMGPMKKWICPHLLAWSDGRRRGLSASDMIYLHHLGPSLNLRGRYHFFLQGVGGNGMCKFPGQGSNLHHSSDHTSFLTH